MENKQITEKQIRKIAREEALIVQKDLLKDLSEVKSTLARLERLLLGELGTDQEDTLKARATFAYQYAKKNVDARVIERAVPALDWFEDMNCVEPGCKESKLQSLGKLITFYTNIRWLLALIGVTTILNALPVIRTILEWIKGI